jgi:hypothetical protein
MKQPGLVYELSTVLQARTPDDLSPQKQAILAYANLKMQSNDFSSYLQGKQAASDVYGKVWVMLTHSDGDQNQLAKRYKEKCQPEIKPRLRFIYPLYQVYQRTS